MPKFLTSLILFPALALALLASPPAVRAEEMVNRVVAVVGDEVITAMDLDKYIKIVKAQLIRLNRGREDNLPSPSEVRSLALERLVDDKIFQQEVKAQGIRVTDEEAERYIDRLKQSGEISNDAFVAQLNHEGMTPEEYKDLIKRDIQKQRLINFAVKQRIVISDEEIARLQKAANQSYEDKDMVTIRAIFFTLPSDPSDAEASAVRQKAEDVMAKVKGGEDFASLAKQYSEGPGASEGGKLGPVSTADMLPAMRQALVELKEGQTSGVVAIPTGYVIMQLVATGGGAVNLEDAELKEQIRAKLEKEAMDERFAEWIKELHAKYYVKILD